jgi:hypothetical protein
MNAPAKCFDGVKLADPLEVLELRAEIRAWLWWRWFDFPTIADAVDPLQDFAEQSGLVADLGQDAVQSLIAAPFARFRNSYTPRPPVELCGSLAPLVELVEQMLAEGCTGAECVAAVRTHAEVQP